MSQRDTTSMKSMLSSIWDEVELLLYLAVIYFLTSHQDDYVSSIIVKSTLAFGGSYGYLMMTRTCHPKKTLHRSIEAEWRSRQLGTIHAVILIVGSVFCFLEWSDLSSQDSWVLNKASNTEILGFYTVLLTCVFVGYLQWDLLWLVYHKKENKDPTAIVHHILYFTMAHYLLNGEDYNFIRPFAWLSLTELSTPFLHLRWFLVTSGKKDSRLYVISSICFALTFLFTRVLCYAFGLIDLWLARDIWLQFPPGIHYIVVGLHGGFALNLFWARKVIRALRKALRTGKPCKTKD